MGALPLATGPAPTAARVHAHFPGPGRQQEGVFFSSGNRWAGRIPRSNSDKARSPQALLPISVPQKKEPAFGASARVHLRPLSICT